MHLKQLLVLMLFHMNYAATAENCSFIANLISVEPHELSEGHVSSGPSRPLCGVVVRRAASEGQPPSAGH